MKQLLIPVLALIFLAGLSSSPLSAGEHKKVMIGLATDDIEITEVDISSLAVGESKTIETDNGRVIDILRTVDGAEVYIDGELLDMEGAHEGHGEMHKIKKHVEVICEDGEECEKNVFVLKGDDVDVTELITDDGFDVILKKEIVLTCEDGEEGQCADEVTWVSEDGEMDIEELHMAGDGEKAHKVIVIKKEVVKED